MAISAWLWSVALAAGCQSTGGGEQAELQAVLTCLPQPPTVELPRELPATPVGVPVAIDVAITNHNPPACEPITFELIGLNGGGLDVDPPELTSAPVASGETTHMAITATASASADPGDTLDVLFFVREPITSFFGLQRLPLVVAATPGCHVSRSHELMITSTSVVDDPARTRFDAASQDPRNGAWTFKRLMEDMAPSAGDAPAMVEAALASFDTAQPINGFPVTRRPGMRSEILASWPRTPDGQLDLAAAPLRLQAIVNRFDLRNLAARDAGEGRFVFGFYDRADRPLQATLILEYKLPAATDQDVAGWAQAFHALGALPFGEAYNAALQAITDRFAGRGVRPGHPNASAINTVRTNEFAFTPTDPWQLRQFGLSPTTGLLEPRTVDLTPDASFNNSEALASYINANRDAIVAETHVVPAGLAGQPFLAGAIFNDLTTWFAPGVDPVARHHFALNTCNGCHSREETSTRFLQISPRPPGGEAALSGFLLGATVPDPVTGAPRRFDDLGRRKADLAAIVCVSAASRSATALRQGIRRVH